jgi:ribosomal protein L16 Arg81 hydroxylase
MKTIKYNVICSFNVGESVPSIKNLLKDMNDILSRYGCSEQLIAKADIKVMEISVNRKLERKEIEIIKRMLQDNFNKSSLLSNLTVKSLTCKSFSKSSKSM